MAEVPTAKDACLNASCLNASTSSLRQSPSFDDDAMQLRPRLVEAAFAAASLESFAKGSAPFPKADMIG